MRARIADFEGKFSSEFSCSTSHLLIYLSYVEVERFHIERGFTFRSFGLPCFRTATPAYFGFPSPSGSRHTQRYS